MSINIKREDLITFLHFREHKEHLDKLITKDPIMSVLIDHDDDDLNQSIKKLLFKIDFALPPPLQSKIKKIDLISLLQDNNGINTNYDGKPILAIHYNAIFDFFLENNLIASEKNKKVFRIEGDSGKGIYMDLIEKEKSISDKFDNCSEKCPAPMEDNELKSIFGHRKFISEDYQKQWHFAFNNKKTMLNWLNSEKDMIEYMVENANAKIVEYQVNELDLISTEKQSAFKIAKAKKLKEYPLHTLIENKIKKESQEFIKNKKHLTKKDQLSFNF